MPSLLSREKIETIYECATDILATVGVEFDMPGARDLLKKHGARINGKKVYFPPSLLEKALHLMPRCHYEPAKVKRLVAGSPFSNAPMIIDDVTGQNRRGTIGDAVRMYQLAETSELYESINPGVIDPEDNDSDDPYIAQVAMMLKYSDKWPSLGLCATKSNTRNGDVYTSARQAIQLIREIKGGDKNPVMSQGICPMAPLSYDEEGLINLSVLAEEGQTITIIPCTLSFMTGPESLMGVVVHDIALSLAGAAYVQLFKPGTDVGFSNSSTMTDMKTMQPVYGSPEYLHVQLMFYEVCRHYGMKCTLGGCFSDGTANDYQTGFESCLTAIAPYAMTEAEEIWCNPGHMSAFAGGSFNKIIFDEELMIYCNRILQGLNLSMDPLLKDKLGKAVESGSFLTIGDVSLYRKEQRVTKIFDKRGLSHDRSSSEQGIHFNAGEEIERRCRAYSLPERSQTQKRLLSRHLPTRCRY